MKYYVNNKCTSNMKNLETRVLIPQVSCFHCTQCLVVLFVVALKGYGLFPDD